MCEVDLISEYNSKFSSITKEEIPTSKICPSCGKRFKRRKRPNGYYQSLASWSIQKFCNQVCYTKSFYNKTENGNFVCLDCGEEKEESEFSRDPGVSKTLRKRCKSCSSLKNSRRWENLPKEEKVLRYLRKKLDIPKSDIPIEVVKAHILQKDFDKELERAVTSKICKGCGVEFFRKDLKLSVKAFTDKLFCTWECAFDFKRKESATYKKELSDGKKCKSCGKGFKARDDESPAHFKVRRYCSLECRIRVNDTVKNCLICDKVITRPTNSKGHLLGLSTWDKITCCSPKCSFKLRSERKRQRDLEQVNASENIKNCIVCGKEIRRPMLSTGYLLALCIWKKKEYCSKKCVCKVRDDNKRKKKELANI